jgi:general secretion pathway protein C
MPIELNQLQQALGESGIRRLALVCNLLLLAWIAWTVAQPIVNWQQADTDMSTAGPPEKQIAWTPETSAREQYDIANWHLFGVLSAQPAQVSPAKANAPETRLNLELTGVYLEDEPGKSRAIIAEKGKQQEHYQVGDRLPGNALLDEIHTGHVLLERNGRYERLALSEQRATGSNGFIGVASPAPRFNIRGNSPQAQPSDSQTTPRLLKLRPVVRDGAFQGMNISAGSDEGRNLLGKANVKLMPRDVIIAINGIEIRSAEAGMALLEDYTEPERLELMIKRGDETIPVIIDPDAVN